MHAIFPFSIRHFFFAACGACLLVFASGCAAADTDNETAKAPKAAEGEAVAENQKQLLEKYNAVVKGAKEAATIVSYLNENLPQADVTTADAMVRGLNAFYDKDLQPTQESFFQGNVQEVLAGAEWPITAVNASSIPDEKVRQLVATKLAGGYKMVMVEGMIYPIVDYELQKTFTKKLSDDLNAYIAIQAEESRQPTAMDASLVISWNELAKRTINTESYLKQYPGAPESDSVRQLFINSYLTMYIIGLNNSPVFDYDTFKLRNEVKESYEETVREHPDSVTGQIVSAYMKLLESTDWKVYEKRNGQQADIPEVKQFHDRFAADAQGMLP
ncbi:hypothetical protein ACFSL6_05450 [Paenibacillus thailandensis]|uniref:Lipoprotein n=1 Tax=Paenibacillus thailandensis TaxID=393250 RepID=A0ABW5QT17_9BACL